MKIGRSCTLAAAAIITTLLSATATSGFSSFAREQPKWNPALLRGRAILFVADGVGRTPTFSTGDIYSLAPSPPYVRNLTHSRADEREAAWSPDGRRIVFVRDAMIDGHRETDLFVMKADGTGVRRLTATADLDETEPSWSPNGSRIAFSDWSSLTPRGIYVMRATGGSPTRIVSGSVRRFPRDPEWSPGSRWIAYERDVYTGSKLTSSIYIVGADGGRERGLTSGATTEDREPSWSPLGSEVLFARQTLMGNFVSRSSIWAVAPPGGSPRKLTKPPSSAAFGDTSPAWSSDGQAFATFSDRFGSIGIVVFHSDGTRPSVLVKRNSFGAGIAWQPTP